jgi:hypothetical protein
MNERVRERERKQINFQLIVISVVCCMDKCINVCIAAAALMQRNGMEWSRVNINQ